MPDDFIEAKILSIFCHELGHSLIDVIELPVLDLEEDAGDTASILLIVETFEEKTALRIATYAALGFAAQAEQSGDNIVWWNQHGADLQRFYNLVCLFCGANPDASDDFAYDLGLPEGRAQNCPEEYDLAIDSWGPVFDTLSDGTHHSTFTFLAEQDGQSNR